MTYLVDSDVLADYLKGRPAAVNLLQSLLSENLAISTITLGEIAEGIHYGNDPRAHMLAFRQFLRGTQVIPVNQKVAWKFAMIRGQLRHTGLLIPDSDLLIAATALAYGLTLITRNRKDFERITELIIRSD